jgi:hypothetical protein
MITVGVGVGRGAKLPQASVGASQMSETAKKRRTGQSADPRRTVCKIESFLDIENRL